MLMVSVALIMAVVVTNIYSKKDSYESCPRLVVRLANSFFPQYLKNFPDSFGVPTPRTSGRTRKTNCNGESLSPATLSIEENESVLEHDDLICCLCHKSRHTSLRDFYSSRSAKLSNQNSFDPERNEAEWKMVSKFVDRILFWIYFMLSVAIQVMLFTHMVPEKGDASPHHVENSTTGNN